MSLMQGNAHLLECGDVINAFGAVAPSSATVQRFSMKGYTRANIFIMQNKSAGNGATVALKQAKEVDNSPDVEKTLSFDHAYRSLAAGTQAAPVQAWERFTVSSDTFTTDATNSVRDTYMIDIKAEDLDIANDFDVVELELGNAASNVIGVLIVLLGAKYPQALPTVIEGTAD